MLSWFRDLRLALRTLLKSRAFAAAAVLSFALGIGANTTIFTFINAIFLRPIPVREPSRLEALYTLDRKNPGFFLCSYPNYLDYRGHHGVFEDLLLYSSVPLYLTGSGAPEQLVGQLVTGNYFSLLGVEPVLGRAFLPDESGVPTDRAVIVISYALWKRRFGAAPDLLGRTITINRHSFTVIGVAPPEFHGLNSMTAADAWVPMGLHRDIFPYPGMFEQRRALLFTAVGRLRPGLSRASAQAAMATIAARLEREYPEANQGRTAVLLPLNEALIHPNLRGTFVLAGGVLMSVAGLVLLIACANVANLLLARAASRHKEIAVQVSLGAGRWPLVRQLLAESVLVAVAGGGLGLALAHGGRDLLWKARPDFLENGVFDPALDARVFAFTAAVALATGVLFGLLPALQATRTDLAIDLKERSAEPSGAGRAGTARGALVVLQVALSVITLVSAGLFLKSLRHAERIDPGFETSHLAVTSFNLGAAGYSEPRGREFQRRLLERVRALPGVTAATLAVNGPFRPTTARTMLPPGHESAGQGVLSLVDRIEPQYFRTLAIPRVAGRAFTAFDTTGTARVAIINEALARRYWPDQPPVGRRFRLMWENDPYEIVGVVRNSNYQELGEAPRGMIYLPLAQHYSASLTLYVQAGGDPEALLGSLRATFTALDPDLVTTNARAVPQIMSRALWASRLGAGLLTAFGLLALVLASLGIYGVVSYSVTQRLREMGIRMALGAQPADVLRQVLRDGMRLVAWGLLLGWAGALLAARAVSRLLFGISAADLPTFAAVSALFAAVALLACYIPARRATRIDPMLALRAE